MTVRRGASPWASSLWMPSLCASAEEVTVVSRGGSGRVRPPHEPVAACGSGGIGRSSGGAGDVGEALGRVVRLVVAGDFVAVGREVESVAGPVHVGGVALEGVACAP